jgi:hypothetical protein
VNSLSKIFNFKYLAFIGPLVRKGRYELITRDDGDRIIIITRFYIDGDVMTELNMVDDELLAVQHPEKAEQHLGMVSKRAGSIEVFRKQVHLVAGSVMTIFPWFVKPGDHIEIKALVSAGIALSFILLRRLISRALLGGVNKLIRPFLTFIKKD